MNQSDRDRREHSRVQIILKVDYQSPTDLLDDYITDLSEGGIFIRTALAVNIGERIEFSLSFPGLLEPLDLAGVIRWSRQETDDEEERPVGLGVEFEFPNEQARQRVRRLVETLAQQSVSEPIRPEHPFRVLLLEDNDRIQEMFRYAVKQFHFEALNQIPLEVFTATSGNEAWTILQRESIDLAILDHYVPGITGAEVVHLVRQNEDTAATPILVVSAGGEEVRKRALEAGADLFLDKPVMLRQLIENIRALALRHVAAVP